MTVLRQIVSSTNGQLLIDIPKEYQQKRFEVIILPLEEITQEQEAIQAKMAEFLNTLPNSDSFLPSDSEILAEIKAVRKERYER